MAKIKVYGVNFDYKEFYEIAQKKINELEKQIEAMKCCGNCKREKCNLQQDISVVKNCIGTDFELWEFRDE